MIPAPASLSTTVVESSGSTRVIGYKPASNPPIDCFYVYPNVSRQQADNANLRIEPQETAIAELDLHAFRVGEKHYGMHIDDWSEGEIDEKKVCVLQALQWFATVGAVSPSLPIRRRPNPTEQEFVPCPVWSFLTRSHQASAVLAGGPR